MKFSPHYVQNLEEIHDAMQKYGHPVTVDELLVSNKLPQDTYLLVSIFNMKYSISFLDYLMLLFGVVKCILSIKGSLVYYSKF